MRWHEFGNILLMFAFRLRSGFFGRLVQKNILLELGEFQCPLFVTVINSNTLWY